MVVDYLSKLSIIKQLASAQAESLVKALKEVFVDWGIPCHINSDNGSQMVQSLKFKEFIEQCEIEHVTSSPLHSSGNDQVKTSIGTIKARIKNVMNSGEIGGLGS